MEIFSQLVKLLVNVLINNKPDYNQKKNDFRIID